MSGERPKAPLWPEGISKARPVENQKPKALTEGVAVAVAKQPSLAEQEDRERLAKPSPAESPVQAQDEPQALERKRTRGRKQLDPDIELLHKSRRAYASKMLWKGLSEEQIAISATIANRGLRMYYEGASPEEIRKMEDELILSWLRVFLSTLVFLPPEVKLVQKL
jgi:hypothetical protein